MNDFIRRHASAVTGMLNGFDRVRFRGTIRLLANTGGLSATLGYLRVLLKDFKEYATGLSDQLKAASLEAALSAGRPVQYLASSHIRKEDVAREIARRDRIEQGLICVLTAVEPCWSFHVRRDRAEKKLVLESSYRKCLHLYHYFQHPVLGFMHARVQSWLPFNVHICINGREWLARQMDQAGMKYRRSDNCFTWVEHVEQAQALFDSQLTVDWAEMLNGVLAQANPGIGPMFPKRPMDYYWSADESEWASDVMFKTRQQLSAVFPGLLRHGMQNLSSREVMRFLGRKDPVCGAYGAFKGEVISDLKERPEGMRIKHRVNANSIKMYDKGSVLRVETLINNPRDFRVYQETDEKQTPGEVPAQDSHTAAADAPATAAVAGDTAAVDKQEPSPTKSAAKKKGKWRPMRKGVSDMHRRAQIGQAANEQYYQAMATVQDQTPLKTFTEPLCEAVKWKGGQVRGLNPLSHQDATLLEHVSRGEFTLNGFRNRDLRSLWFKAPAGDEKESRRRSAAVTRMIRMLRAHRLVQKRPRTHRYIVTSQGRSILTALLSARQADTAKLTAIAA
jgi:hypothetical protein